MNLVLLNILLIALPLALFEIIIEGSMGWGGGWSKDKWYAKAFRSKSSVVGFIVRIAKIEPPLNYHMVVFGLVIPLILVLEYIFFTKDIFLLFSIFITVVITEDFFWFALNWNFNSMRELLKGPNGSIWWHKRWITIARNTYLPFAYLIGLIFFIILYELHRLF